MTLDADAARRSFTAVAERFKLSPEQAAASALSWPRQHRARDPAGLDRARAAIARLCAGAVRRRGPLHAARIAEELGISTIVVPPNAGVISAYGLVASDYTKFDAVTRKMKLDEAAAQKPARPFGEMRARLAAQFAT